MNTAFEKSILQRFPKFELSYETISHKKVSSQNYQVALGIPQGKKYYAWFSYDENRDVCYLMELARDKKIANLKMTNVPSTTEFSLGTIFYGTITEPIGAPQYSAFVIEDVFFYKGICVKQQPFSEKLGIMDNFLQMHNPHPELSFALPFLWKYDDKEADIPKPVMDRCGYHIHHVQYRSLNEIVPYINLSTKTKAAEIIKPTEIKRVEYAMDFTKPQYRYPTVFSVMADVQFDIYHLYAYGQNKTPIYCGIDGIPTYKTSVYMNGIFRKIRENGNIDYIEESDDEDDFENTSYDKYVDASKTVLLECTFHPKFKKWIPTKQMPANSQVVHIHKLARM